jgi:hypothetical protein
MVRERRDMSDRDRLACADCGVSTRRLNEWYMVRDDVWEQAWAGHHKPEQLPPAPPFATCRLVTARDGSAYKVLRDHNSVREILCIGCLEQRIGRTLMASDFTAAPVNDPNHPLSGHKSERLRHRLSATTSMPLRPTRAAAHRDNCPVLQGSARRRQSDKRSHSVSVI